MITEEKLEELLDSVSYDKTKDDRVLHVLTFLRNRIPIEVERDIVRGCRNEAIWLCDIDVATKYLNEEDAMELGKYCVFIDEDSGCLAIYA